MIVLLLAAIAIVLCIVAARMWRRRRRGVDVPVRLVVRALRWLPADRREWAHAMLAELAYIDGRSGRWRYAIGAVRVALLPPTRHPRGTAVVAVTGLLIAATAAIAVHLRIPTLTVFVAVLGVAVCLYATVRVARARGRADLSLPYVLVAATALAAIAATIAAFVRVAVLHPAATTDSTHIYAIGFALILTGYIVIALRPPLPARRTGATVLWWALGGALCGYAAWGVAALRTPPELGGTIGYLWVVGAATTATAAIGTAVSTRSSAACIRAGVLTAILTSPAHVALDITTMLNQHHYTLSSAYDLTAYPRSGYPDIASYLLSDAIGGEIFGLVFYPIVLLTISMICAALCGRPSRRDLERPINT
jgi:hypothetical protein